MARVVYVPELGRSFSFKDGASNQDISAYLVGTYGRVASASAPLAPKEQEIGPWESSGLGWLSRFQTTGGGIAELLGADDTAKYLYDKAQANLDEAAKYQPEEPSITGAETWGGSASALGDAAIQSAPDLAGGLGSAYVGGQIGAGIGGLGGPAAPVTVPVGATIGALVGGGLYAFGSLTGSNIQRQAQEQGKTLQEADERTAMLAAAAQAPLEALADRILLGRLVPPGTPKNIVNKIVGDGVIKHATKGAIAEGLTEPAQQAIEIAQANPEKLFSFSPEVQTELLDAAFAGGFLGGVVGGVATPLERMAEYRRTAPQRQLASDLDIEKRQSGALQRNADINSVAEDLRQYNVEGPVSIIEDEIEGGSAYTIKAKSGNMFGVFYNPDDAKQAIETYKQRTGAKISIAEPVKPPRAFPVKINEKEFNNIDEIMAERDSAVSVRDDLAGIAADPVRLKAQADIDKISPEYYRTIVDEAVKKQEKVIAKFDDFLATARGEKKPQTKAAPVTGEPVANEPVITEEDVNAPVDEEAPVAEMPVEESRVLEEATPPTETLPEAEPLRTELRSTATADQTIALQTELFGAPKNVRDMTPEERATYEAERDRRYPPEEVPVYYDASLAPDARPRKLSELQPNPRAETPEYKAMMESVYTGVESRLKGIVPADLRLKQSIADKPGYILRGAETTEQTPDGTKSVIELATQYFRPGMTVEEMVKDLVGTLNHEIIHVLRTEGRLRPAEWKMLSRAAANTKVPGKKYTYLDKATAVYEPMGGIYSNPEEIAEEAVAEMYKDWVAGKNNKEARPVGGLFNRITEFLRRIFRALKASRYEDVFKRIESGEMKTRERGPGREADTRFSASVAPGAPISDDLEDRSSKAFQLYPYLRSASPRYYDHKPKILGTTNPGNAARQIQNLDQLLAAHPNALASNAAWANYVADAMGKDATAETGVPIIPYKAVQFANNPDLIVRQLGGMTQGQLDMAEDGLSAAKDFEQAYRSGTATPMHTAKLILWGILSRGVSPFVQESMFLDVVNPVGVSNRTGRLAGTIDQFIQDSIEGNFDLNAYRDYVKTLKIDGLPGAGTTHNLGAFGTTTLVKLQQRVPDGRTILQYLHDLISDYNLSGKQIRRMFHEVNPGIGINNKVLSFMMLVSGRDDVMVLDRVQMRNQFNDGRFDDYNLYDGVKVEKLVTKKDGSQKLENVTDTGSGMAKLGDGVRGLMYYEALERDLTPAVREAYNRLGRGNQFSMGRYHWESWVATSAQEVDHGSVSGLIKDALGEMDPYSTISTGEGKYDTFNSGIKYGYTPNGEPVIGLPDGLGRHYNFTPEYAKKVIAGYDKRSTGIIRDANFKVSTSTEGPWYDRPEVDKDKLRAYLQRKSDEFKAERGRAIRKGVQEAGSNNPNRPGPGPVHGIRRRGGLRQPEVTNPKTIADKYIPRDGARFSAAPALDSDEFKRWFRKSRVVNEDGSPKVLYHGTNARVRFTTFDTLGSELGSHFGTQKQASKFVTIDAEQDEYRTGGRIYPVYLSIQNPLRLRDLGNWDNDRVAPQLLDAGLIDQQTYDTVMEGANLPFREHSLRERTNREILQKAIRKAGYDGIVYLNRFEGLNSDPENTINVDFNDDRELNELTDSEFKSYIPEAEDSYIVLGPTQVKSIFNEFTPGEARRLRFAAAPLPAYIETRNDTLFAPAPKEGFFDWMSNMFLGPPTQAKILNMGGQNIEISKGKMRRLKLRTGAVDDAAFVEELEKQANLANTGNYERLTADYSAVAAIGFARRATQLGASLFMKGKMVLDYARPGDLQSATMKIEEDPDSMKEIIKVLMEPGPVDSRSGEQRDKRELFKSYASAMRARNLKAMGVRTPNELDDQYINTVIPFTEREYPEVVEAYKKYQRFNRNLLKTAKEVGLIDDVLYQKYVRNMDYYGFYREVYETIEAPGTPTKLASKFEMRAMKGSEHGDLVNDPVYVMVHNAQFWVSAIAKNLAAKKSFTLARDMGVARLLAPDEKPDRARGEEEQVMFFRENGVQRRFAVSDPMLVTALGSDDRGDVGRFFQIMGMPTQILRETVTRDPGFMIANLMRDTLSAWITSGADITPFIGTAKGFAKAYKNSASYQALMGRGIVGSYDLAMRPVADVAAELRRRAMPSNVLTLNGQEAATAVARGLWNRLGALSEYSDAATRIAVYEAAKAQGMSDAEAAFRAIEILDFSRRGGSQAISILTKIIPFLNARIQGLDVLYQAGKAGVKVATGRADGDRERDLGKKFLVRGGMLAAISMFLEWLNEDDEDYKQLDNYIKDSNLLIPLRMLGLEGQFLAVPKPFEAGLLFSTMPQQFYKSLSGDASARENVNMLVMAVGSTFGINPIPQAILPVVEIITNHDFYTGLPLISEGKARLAPELQYNSGTSQLAMMLGKIPIWYNFDTGRFEGQSPIVIDQLIGGYGGPLGTYLAQSVGMAMEATEMGPERLPRDLSQLPVVKRFFLDAEKKNPKVVTQAYELFRIVDEANRSFSRLRQTGDAEATLDYLEENKDILSYKKYVFKLVDRLNKLSAHERAIERDKTMTDDEKREAMKRLREVRIRLASKVGEINEKLGR